MNAVHLDPSDRIFGYVHEPRRGPRLTRKTLFAVGITAVFYAGLGFYFVTMKYELAPAPTFVDPPIVTTDMWRVVPEPPEPVVDPAPQKTVTTRPPPSTIPIDAPTTSIAPSDQPSTQTMPTIAIGPVDTPVIDAPPSVVAPPTPPSVIRNPVWISRPTPEQVGKLYPERAANRGMTGSATLWCGIRANGTMTDCQVVDESPAGWRFGAAALSMAQYFRISPKTVDGKPVEGSRVRIPVVFSLSE